jgi:hypothetical protein
MNSNEQASLLFRHNRFYQNFERAGRAPPGGADLFAAPAADLSA